MSGSDWMLYGATGFTGVLVAEEAVRRGHRPLLAGRSAEKLARLAERLGLEYMTAELDDAPGLARAVAAVRVVYHAAGPFVHTAEQMRRVCMTAGVHYLDITAELGLLQAARKYDAAARERGVALIPGVGFDVVPTNCLAKLVADQVPGATDLEMAVTGMTSPTAGTARSLMLSLHEGGAVRRDGRLAPHPFGQGARRLPSPRGPVTAIPTPWGDLETAYWATGIPNITAYMIFPGAAAALLRLAGPLVPRALSIRAVRDLAAGVAGRMSRGPSAAVLRDARSYIWARAADREGHAAEAWLETAEAYRFTALAAVRAVEKVLETHPVGVLAPAQAFGAGFIMEIEGTRRLAKG